MGEVRALSARRLRLGAARPVLVVAIAAVVGLFGAATAAAQAPATTILVFHGAPNPTIDAGVDAIEALGAANDFAVETSQDAAGFTAANLEQYRAIVFLGNAGDALSAAQESALQGYIDDGGGFVGIGGAAEGEPGSTFYGNLIGARPAAGSPTGTAEKVVAVGDRVHPATEDLPLEWNRHGRLVRVADPAHAPGPHRRPLPRARRPRRRRHRHRRHRLADLVVPRLPGRPLLLHRHGPHRGRLRRGPVPHPPARRHPVERRHDPRRLQGDDRRQLRGRAPDRRHERDARAHGRVARRRHRPQRLGLHHRPRRLPHRRAARPDDRPGPDPAHPRLREPQRRRRLRPDPHLGPGRARRGRRQQRRHARRRPARLRRPGGRRRDQRQDRGRPARDHRVARLHADGPHLPPVLPDLQPRQPGAPRPRRRGPAAHHQDVQAADQPLHGRPRHQAGRLRLRGRDLRVRVADLQLLPPRRRHGLRLRGQSLRHHRRLQLVAAHQWHVGQLPARALSDRRPHGGLERPLRQQRHLVQRRAPNRRQHQRLQRQDAAPEPGRHDRGRSAADGRRQLHVHVADRHLAERPEPLQRHRGQRQPGQAGDLRDGPAQPVAPVHRPRDRRPVLGVGRPRRRLAVGDPGPVDLRERHPAGAGRQLWLAVLHGQPAGLPRPRRGRLAADDERARVRHRRPGRQPHAGLVRLQEPRQRLDEQHRPDRAPARDRDRDGRRHRAPGEPLVQPRQSGRRQRLPGLPARERRRQRAELRLADAGRAVPLPHRLRRHGLQRPRLPLRRGRHRKL